MEENVNLLEDVNLDEQEGTEQELPGFLQPQPQADPNSRYEQYLRQREYEVTQREAQTQQALLINQLQGIAAEIEALPNETEKQIAREVVANRLSAYQANQNSAFAEARAQQIEQQFMPITKQIVFTEYNKKYGIPIELMARAQSPNDFKNIVAAYMTVKRGGNLEGRRTAGVDNVPSPNAVNAPTRNPRNQETILNKLKSRPDFKYGAKDMAAAIRAGYV